MAENKKEYDYQKRKKNKLNQLILVVIILISCLSLVTVLARYVVTNIGDFFLRTKEFYFYSDKLKEDNAVYQIDNWSGVDDYVITVNMNSNDNNLKSTSYDIGYDISFECSDNAICQLSKESGIISATTNTDYFNLTITPNAQLNNGDRVSVTITANSTTNYQKKLEAKFILVVGIEKTTYEIVDSVNNPYLELNITNTLSYYQISEAFDKYQVGDRIDRETYLGLDNTKKSKCYSAQITLKFNPNEVLLDMTNNNYLNALDIKTTQINNQEYINEITFKVEAISSTKVRFYKVDITKNYTYPIINNTSIITLTSV